MTTTITIEIDTETDLTPEERKTLEAVAHLNGRTVEEQLKLALLGSAKDKAA
jgi:hypothetical protein